MPNNSTRPRRYSVQLIHADTGQTRRVTIEADDASQALDLARERGWIAGDARELPPAPFAPPTTPGPAPAGQPHRGNRSLGWIIAAVAAAVTLLAAGGVTLYAYNTGWFGIGGGGRGGEIAREVDKTLNAYEDKGGTPAAPIDSVAWSDYRSAVAGSIARVSIDEVRAGTVAYTSNGSPGESHEHCLVIRLRVENARGGKPLRFRGWGRSNDSISVQDESGAEYRLEPFPVSFRITGEATGGGIPPGAAATDVLAIEGDAANARTIYLTLNGSIIGQEQPIRFEIPASAWERPEPSSAAPPTTPPAIPPDPTPIARTPPESPAPDPVGDAGDGGCTYTISEWSDPFPLGDAVVRVHTPERSRPTITNRDTGKSRWVHADDGAGWPVAFPLSIASASDTVLPRYKTWRKLQILTREGIVYTRPSECAQLVDEFGTEYRPFVCDWDERVLGTTDGPVSIYEGQTVRDLLIFERPLAAATMLTLILPGGALGVSDETICLEIPTSAIRDLRPGADE